MPRPAAGCPFITKAHETLTRRPGGSSVSVSRVRRRPAYHRPNRVRRGGSRRPRVSQVASSHEAGSGSADPEGLRSRGSTRGCFQRGSSCEPLPPRVPGHCQPPGPRFDRRDVLVPQAQVSAGLPRVCGSLNPRPTPLRTVQRLFDTLPLPDYEPGVRGVTPVHSVTQMMVLGRFSCPGPARPCSGFQLVLATLGLILFPRRRRPLRPPRACRASQLTGYLIASG